VKHWLVKSEPVKWGWEQMVKAKRTHWDGVRNYAASNNLKAMKLGDEAFFYHSNEGLEIVGIVEIVREYYPDPSDESGRFGMVDVQASRPLKTFVTLKQMKADPALSDLVLIRQGRLSVSPVSDAEWKHICKLGGVDPK
jgi:predicted RNA-binding protein with PUA-like domain